MAGLQLLAKQLEKEFGIKCIQIHIHRDEGFNKTNPDPSNLNLHAHFVADWTHDNGTSLRLGRQDTTRKPQKCFPSPPKSQGLITSKDLKGRR